MTQKSSAAIFKPRFKLYFIGILKYRVRKKTFQFSNCQQRKQNSKKCMQYIVNLSTYLIQSFNSSKSTQPFVSHHHLFLIIYMLPSQLTIPSQKKSLAYSSTSVLLMHSFITVKNCSICYQCPPEGILLYICAIILCSAQLLLLLPTSGVSQWEKNLQSKLLLFSRNFSQFSTASNKHKIRSPR